MQASTHLCHVSVLLLQLCERALATSADGDDAGADSSRRRALLEFWRCFALSRSGAQAAAIAGLDALLERPEGAELGLPCVALLLSAHNAVQPPRARDKAALLALKSRLKVVSKQSSEAALQLAGRYFLATGKIPKARQCIEKLIAKDKKNVALLSLFGWIYLLSGDPKYEEKSMQGQCGRRIRTNGDVA
jgi:tetratricopeptide (TPR) repeat protein